MDEVTKQTIGEIKRAIIIMMKKVWNVSELAVVLDLSESRVRKLAAEGEFPSYKPGGGKLYFKREEIEAWQTRNRSASKEEVNAIAATRCALSRLK